MKQTDPHSPHYIAIDVAKATLQVQDQQGAFTVANAPKGLRQLCQHAQRCPNPLVVFEASGGYERALRDCLHQAQLPWAMVNPARVRADARSEGVRAKTDPLDSQMILAFAQSKALRPMQQSPEVNRPLTALLDRRSHLVEQLAREKNRLQNSGPLIQRSIQRMIRILEKEVRPLDEAITKLVQADAVLQARASLLQSVAGVGPITAWTLLAYLCEMATPTRNQLVALAGIAPLNSDSGTYTGRRRIQSGRAKVRKCLYMAAQTAAIHNPVIAAYVEGLRARGKPYKGAIVAAMRKLLIHLQSLIKKEELAPC